MELQAILDAITANPKLADGIFPVIAELPSIKTVIDAKANSIFTEKINDEINKTHSRYDQDIFEILGQKPKAGADGKLEKTYEFNKRLLADYKRLLEVENGLNKDEKVKELQAAIDKLKADGGGAHVQAVFDQAKAQWTEEKKQLEERAAAAEGKATDGLKINELANARAGLKLNPDLPEGVKTNVIKSVEAELLKNSKIEDGKVIFLTPEGKPMLNAQYQPMTAAEVLASHSLIKEISLTDKTPGGGANPGNIGKVTTTQVEGKDKKVLNLDGAAFKSKSEFLKVSAEALTASGLTKRDPEYTTLQNEAYVAHSVEKLPAE